MGLGKQGGCFIQSERSACLPDQQSCSALLELHAHAEGGKIFESLWSGCLCLTFLLPRHWSVPSGCPCSKKGWVAVHLLLLYIPCKFSCEIWYTGLGTKFFKGGVLDPVVKRRVFHAALASQYEEKIGQSPWGSFVRGECIQLMAYSLIACVNFSEVAVYSRYTHCFHK